LQHETSSTMKTIPAIAKHVHKKGDAALTVLGASRTSI
jgi:hypothetical protein